MPFKSIAQRKWMYAHKPELAAEFDKDSTNKRLPKRVKPRKEKRHGHKVKTRK